MTSDGRDDDDRCDNDDNDDDDLDDDDVVDDDEDGFPDGPLDKRMDDASLLSIASTKLLSVASSRNDALQVKTLKSLHIQFINVYMRF